MSDHDIVRAWKDAEYRAGLSEAERAALPVHPAGLLDLSDAELDTVAGALGPKSMNTGCWGLPICQQTYPRICIVWN